ncbi:fumarylacetoacetate hydrolase family protein [Sphingobium boeckii]|uniref:2-keto-4-pentenoate hydratase/2-oxohepta-3-ene-1,7-dioic acid hydratase in catechol pathway n=1 Tax=Sphingobium boeckii TaxID=1082345 RepID=A0A7W9EG24_9SPHN|nr:fumarylacetoacetate hydrolase family protein [Sphingobium boeckii]MBB5687739.1 2-keto-4-pentenoate hydratase/2-oxohepta-3-ene-1,7-dioic acid hydratase in catechol pathway [Sphingobium boeckii]
MKLISFEHNGRASYGIARADGIIDLGKHLGSEFPTLKKLLAADALDRAAALADQAADVAFDAISYLPVIPNPMHLWCLALNYVEHHKEVESAGRVQELPKKPALFLRAADSMTGHQQPLRAPAASEQFDYEGELAVIIGKGGRNISEADAMSHVAGFAVFNDGSIRDWQFHTKQITPGKNFYQTAALGPQMVTADEIADVDNLSVKTWLNGQLVQDGNTRDMLFKIPAFIAYASIVAPLVPGDVLATGTPSGVGFSRKPPLWMKAGDRCEIEIEGVGRLSNPVMAEG